MFCKLTEENKQKVREHHNPEQFIRQLYQMIEGNQTLPPAKLFFAGKNTDKIDSSIVSDVNNSNILKINFDGNKDEPDDSKKDDDLINNGNNSNNSTETTKKIQFH